MKKIILYITAMIAVSAAITSCLPEKASTALTYKGPTVVEFKNQDVGQIDTVLYRKGVYACTAQTDSSRSVNQDAIAYKATAATANTLSCVTAGGTTYQLKTNTALAANARGVDTIWVQLVGSQQSSDIVLNFTVRPTTAAVNPSTATEGVNYDFIPTGTRTVTIPANRSVGYILTTIKSAMTTAGSTAKISIDLVGNSIIAANPNYSKFFVTIRKN